MSRNTVGVLEDKVVGGKGYRVEWATTSLVPLGEWTEYYIQSSTFKLWGNDLRFKIDISQPLSQRNKVEMMIKVIPEDPKAWATNCKNTEFFLWAKYQDGIFDSRKREGAIYATLTSPNVFNLNFKLPLNKETGAPEMTKPFEIKLVVEKSEKSCSLKLAKASFESQKGIRNVSVEMGRLLANPEGSDLTIRCRNQKFSVHKFILSARSTTLKKMMGEMQEDTIELNRVKGRAMTPRAVKRVLEWIYTGGMKDMEDHLTDSIIALGELWGLDELVNSCRRIEDLNYLLENPEENEEIQLPPKKKSKTETKDYNLVLGDLKVIPWKSRGMKWKFGVPKLEDKIKDLYSPSFRFFGVDWSLLMKVHYNTDDMEDVKSLKDFKTIFQISLQPETNALHGAKPKLKFLTFYDDPEYAYSLKDTDSPSHMEDSDLEDEDCNCEWCPKTRNRVKQVGINKYMFLENSSIINRLYEKDHEIEINWTLKLDFENATWDKMNTKINSEKGSLNLLAVDLGSLLESNGDQDVVLRCDGKDFQAHKIILAARSDVFKAMLETPMKESLESVIEVRDGHGELVGRDVVGAILRWMYTGDLGELDEEHTLISLGLADFYNLSKLKELCEDKLKGLIKKENVVDILLMADFVRAVELKREAIQFLHKNKSIAKAKEFKDKVGWDLFQDIFTWVDN